MRGRRSRSISGLLLVAFAVAGVAAADERSARGYELQVYRYDVAPNVVLGKQERVWSARMPYGELGVDAYLVVVRLAPGERFVSARAEVRDGFFCIPRRAPGKRMAGKNGPGRHFYNAIKLLPKQGICPFCDHRPVSTLDHLLP